MEACNLCASAVSNPLGEPTIDQGEEVAGFGGLNHTTWVFRGTGLDQLGKDGSEATLVAFYSRAKRQTSINSIRWIARTADGRVYRAAKAWLGTWTYRTILDEQGEAWVSNVETKP